MNLEARFFDLVRYIGILAPLPTAYLIGVSVNKHLAWPGPIALITALIVEGIGFGAVYEVTLFREYNQTKRKTDPDAPTHYALGLVAAYVVSVLVLTIVLDVLPQASTVAPAIFPFLSLIGMAITALRNDHESRLQAIAEEKAERKEKRQEALRTAGKDETPVTQPPQEPATPEPQALDTQAKILAYYRKHPQGSQTQAGKAAGVSRQRVGQYLKGWEQEGLVHVNGNGVEVLG